MGTPDEPRRQSRRSYAAALCFGGRKSPFGGVLGEHARPVQNRQRRVGSAQHHDLGFHVVTAVAIGRNLQLHRLEAHAVVLAHRALETRAQDVSQRWADPGHEGAAVRASPPCSFGTERGGLRVRGRRGCRHRTGPVRVGFAGRTSPSAPGRGSHRAFFRAPHKGDDTRPWITGDTAHRGERTKIREARYASRSGRCRSRAVAMPTCAQFPALSKTPKVLCPQGFAGDSCLHFTHTTA